MPPSQPPTGTSPARPRATRAARSADPASDKADDARPSGRRTLNIENVTDLSILGPGGEALESEIPDLPDAEFVRIYRAMVLTRKFDVRMLNMQRQGQMGTFAPGYGQEATQIPQVYWLTKEDWFSPSYRSFGAQIWRGWAMDHLMLLWAGYHEGFAPPPDVNDLPFSIVIGSHLPLATGVAMGLRYREQPGVMVCNFGDGASSEGAVHEAMNFAAVYAAPVVFVLENNGYAISTKISTQTRTETFAARAAAYGMPGIRADGNDILAMLTACREGVEHARAGNGPTLIEAVTYRMGVHTTADDPKVYRDDDEVEAWKRRCPIERFEQWLLNRGTLDAATVGRIAEDCDREVLEARDRFRERAVARPEEIFDYVYETMPPELREQKAEYLARLRRKGLNVPKQADDID